MSDSPFGINVIGPASANLGIGRATREFASALMSNGHPVAIFDVDAGGGRSGFDLSLQGAFVSHLKDLPHAVNLWQLGAFDLPSTALQICAEPDLRNRFNAGFVWWELPDLPAYMAKAALAFDALIAGSEYVQETARNAVDGVPVLLARHPTTIPAGVASNRERFNLPQDALLVYTGFEPRSDPERKNPFAAIEAFTRAFAGRSDVRLVIKVNNPAAEGRSKELVERVYRSASADPRMLILRDSLSYGDLLALYASCDVFISLHRSEGLGLIPLEAMRLGKPVVVTAWSGNMSYMTQRNSCPVVFKLVPITEDAVSYAPSRLGIESSWADPDIDHAAAWLRKLADEPEFRVEIGQRAAEDSAKYDEAARAAEFLHELDALRNHKHVQPAKNHAAIRAALQHALGRSRLDRLPPMERFARTVSESVKEALDRHLLWRLRKPQ